MEKVGGQKMILRVKRRAISIRDEIALDLQPLAEKWFEQGLPGLGRMLQIIDAFYRVEKEGYLITHVNAAYDLAYAGGLFDPVQHRRARVCQLCKLEGKGEKPQAWEDNPQYVWWFGKDDGGGDVIGWYHQTCFKKAKKFHIVPVIEERRG